MKLYCLKYNNYANRIVRKEDNLSSYLAKDPNYQVISNVSFNPGDGVKTEQVFNYNIPNITGDYAIYATDTGEIKSRWFIIDGDRKRTGQYILTLRRDLVVDSYDSVINAPCFIEKATLDKTDPMIFNSENMGFNQIKKNEYLLQDETKSAWVVGYVPNNFGRNDAGTYETKQVNAKVPLDHWDIEVTNLQDWEYYQYIDNYFSTASTNNHYGIAVSLRTAKGQLGVVSSFNEYGTGDTLNRSTFENPYFSFSNNTGLSVNNGSNWLDYSSSDLKIFVDSVIKNAKNQYNTLNDLVNAELGLPSTIESNNFLALRGKIIKVGTDFYKIDLVSEWTNRSLAKKLAPTSDMFRIFDAQKPTKATVMGTSYTVNGTANNQTYMAYGEYKRYKITLSPVYGEIKCSIDTSKIYELNDSPYKMFCIPYSDELKVYKNGALQYTSSKNIALSLGTAIGESVGSANVYDVQLLPFCPLREYIKPSMAIWNIDAEHIADIDNQNEDFKMIVKSTYTQDSYVAVDGELSNDFTLNIYNTQSGKLLKTYKGSYFGVFSQGFSFTDATQELFALSWTDYNNSGTTIELIVAKGAVLTSENMDYTSVLYQFNGMTIQPAMFDYGDSVSINDITNGQDNVVGKVFWCRTSTFTFNIDKFGDKYISDVCKVTNPKIQNETEMWRLVSPNYNGQFEFSVAKNGGVTFFNVDCNYKPFNPYIHINPDWGLLYGKDFNDARGLICGGDFSLPQVSNAWANYETTNKNYQNIFNREVQNMEVNNNVSRVTDVTGAIAGTVSGSFLGGATGGVLTGAAGLADIVANEYLRTEAMDFKRDMFGYQLGNIKAMPNSLTRTSAFTYNNKIFPILEYYSCTDEEVEALENKLLYNGMTVMRIGKIKDFIIPYSSTYIKGRLIRLDGTGEDFHYVKELSDEIYKGGYF